MADSKKPKTAEEEYEEEERTYQTHPAEQDTLGEAIHRSVKVELGAKRLGEDADYAANSIPKRHKEYR